MTAPTLTEFLLARIAEDEDRDPQYGYLLNVEHHTRDCDLMVSLSDYSPSCDCVGPKRWLAECEAKRRIVNLCDWGHGDGPYLDGWNDASDMTLRHMARPYASHPDYRQEWKP